MIYWFLFLKSSKWATTSVYQLDCDSHKQTLALAQQTFNGLIFTFDRRSRQNEVKELIRKNGKKNEQTERKNKSKLSVYWTFVSICLNEWVLPPDDDFVCQPTTYNYLYYKICLKDAFCKKLMCSWFLWMKSGTAPREAMEKEFSRYVRSYCDDFIVGISTSFISWLIYLFVNQIYAI